MARDDLVRIEFSIRRDDAELLKRMASQRGCGVSELIRRALYDKLTPLANAQRERDEIAAMEVRERHAMATWTGQKL